MAQKVLAGSSHPPRSLSESGGVHSISHKGMAWGRLSAPGLGWGPAGERRTGGLPEGGGWSGGWDSVGLGGELGALGVVTWRELSGALGVMPTGGEEAGLEAAALSPSCSNCSWRNRQRSCRELELGGG